MVAGEACLGPAVGLAGSGTHLGPGGWALLLVWVSPGMVMYWLTPPADVGGDIPEQPPAI